MPQPDFPSCMQACSVLNNNDSYVDDQYTGCTGVSYVFGFCFLKYGLNESIASTPNASVDSAILHLVAY